MMIETFIASKDEALKLVADLLINEFLIEEATAKKLYDFQIKPIVNRLSDDCFLLAETNYVDKVYRDSYYAYYSSKLFGYARNCVRISIFQGEVHASDFRSHAGVDKIRKKYLGYFLLRPTDPSILGRNLISPRAFKAVNFSCATASFQTTVNGIKLSVDGFPHSSQDSETITCAETTIWAIMEYFSHRYPEYRPVLPSRIIQTLNRVSTERQIPSKGLNIQQMSYALREFGFGTRIYSRPQYGAEFNLLLACYIESGIPLIIALNDDSGIGHSLLCIGREQIVHQKIDALSESAILNNELSQKAKSAGIEILDFAAIERSYVFVDDNHSVYQIASVNEPALHYDKAWHRCRISFFIAPLYQKIYLEAYQAKNYILRFLISGPMPLKKDSKVIMRQFLASSRTLKDQIALNDSFNEQIKEIILGTPMPKFVWVCELTDKEALKGKKALGIIILDATEANIRFNKPLILAAYQDNVVSMDNETKKLENNVIPLNNFSIFEGNLKSFSS